MRKSAIRRKHRVSSGSFFRFRLGDEAGERRLDAAGCGGKAERIERHTELEQADFLGTNDAGEEYFIEEACGAGDEAGCSEPERTLDQIRENHDCLRVGIS